MHLAWACGQCEKRPPEVGDLAPYTMKMLRFNALRRAGFPLRADDLTLEEWEDLGLVAQWTAIPAL